MMEMRPFSSDAVRHIVRNMRRADREEVYATRWTEKEDDLVSGAEWAQRLGHAWIAHDGEPVAVVGMTEIHPRVWTVWMFATDRFDKVARMLTRHAVRVMIPMLRGAGAHRAECRTIVSHTTAHRWLEFLGGRKEALLKKYGKSGQDFYLYASDLSASP
jgi:hypothetical protein